MVRKVIAAFILGVIYDLHLPVSCIPAPDRVEEELRVRYA